MGRYVFGVFVDVIDIGMVTMNGFEDPSKAARLLAGLLVERPLEGMCGVRWDTVEQGWDVVPGTAVLRIIFVEGGLARFVNRHGNLGEYLQGHYRLPPLP